MQTRRRLIEVPALVDRDYEVIIGEGLLADAGAWLAAAPGGGRSIVIADDRVMAFYGEALVATLRNASIDCSALVFAAGEASKTRDVVARLQDEALVAGVRRDSRVLALGGGVAGDIAGYVAASLLRGIPWIMLPTTLLAMVDSAVGGKTGVDTARGKNLVGAFWQPRLVLADVATLATLPQEEFAAGLAEVIKYGVILDDELFTDLEDGLLESCLARVPEAIALVVERCVGLKAAVVKEDERDDGKRQILNFGHTCAHGIEAASGYRLRHGEAVAVGMIAEAKAAEILVEAPSDLAERIEALCARAGLPTVLPEEVAVEQVVDAARSDKKMRGDTLRCALPTALGSMARDGHGDWSVAVSDDLLAAALAGVGGSASEQT